AAHAVEQGHHLRHGGHFHALAGDPGTDAADGDGQQHEQISADTSLHVRMPEGDDRGQQHAATGPLEAGGGSAPRAHALEAINEQDSGDEIARINNEIPKTHSRITLVGSGSAGAGGAGLAQSLEVLNMSSMRSVTT